MLLSPQALEDATVPLPEVLEFAAANAGPQVDMNDVEAFRSVMRSAVAALNDKLPPAHDILETDIAVPMRDGYKAVAKVRRPLFPSAGGCPLIVLVFGGGWVAGDNEQMAVEARAFVRTFSAVVVNISYRLAPECKFPQGWEDSWDNLIWLSAHAAELGADPSKGFLVGGTSAGAGIAAICARKAQLEPLAFPLTGQWLNCPSILSHKHVPEKWKHLYISLKQNEHAPIFPAAALDILQKQTGWDMDSPWRSPMGFKHSLAGLPKTYIQVDGMDCLRDDGLIYDELLKEAGVKTRCNLYVGCPHAHATFVPGKAMERAQIDTMKNFGWMLGFEVDERVAREALGLM